MQVDLDVVYIWVALSQYDPTMGTDQLQKYIVRYLDKSSLPREFVVYAIDSHQALHDALDLIPHLHKYPHAVQTVFPESEAHLHERPELDF